MYFKDTYVNTVLDRFTIREIDTWQLMAEGCSNGSIAKRLMIEESTVCKHINHIYSKLNLSRYDENTDPRVSAVRIWFTYKDEILRDSKYAKPNDIETK